MKFLMDAARPAVVERLWRFARIGPQARETPKRAAIGQRVQRWDSQAPAASVLSRGWAMRRVCVAELAPDRGGKAFAALWHSSCARGRQKQFNRNKEMNPALTSSADVMPSGTRRPRTVVQPERNPSGWLDLRRV